MHTLTITDKDAKGFLTIGLIDILRLSKNRANLSQWENSGLECLGLPESHELYRIAETGARLDENRFLRLANECSQVIDGVFEAYEPGQKKPWLIIRAVDSAAYDIESDDKELLSRIRRSFKELKELYLVILLCWLRLL